MKIEYYEKGQHKLIFKVYFELAKGKQGESIDLTLITKTGKGRQDIATEEIEDINSLSDETVATRHGEKFEYKGDVFYIE